MRFVKHLKSKSIYRIEAKMSVAKHILILIAMDEEAKPFVDHHKLLKVNIDANIPSIAYQGLINDVTITVVVNGNDACSGVSNVGTVPG